MSRYRIIPTEPAHLNLVAAKLRTGDAEEFAAVGLTTPRQIARLLRGFAQNSTHCWTAYVGDEIALVGGCEATLLGTTGRAWLVTTPAIERVPMAFAKEARRWLTEVLSERSAVVTSCLASYEKSARFWSMLGFRFTDTTAMPNGAIFQNMLMERG